MNPRTQALFARMIGNDVDMPALPDMTEQRVPPSGPTDAIIAVIGEAPGIEEAERGEPFIGRSGKLIRQQARYGGVKLENCYLDNVYPYYPPAGKIANIEAGAIEEATRELVERLKSLTRVRVLVLAGNIALKAILGFEGITKHRGSIYLQDGVRVIPVIHPAAVLRGQKQWHRRCCLDWQRIGQAARIDNHSSVERQAALPDNYAVDGRQADNEDKLGASERQASANDNHDSGKRVHIVNPTTNDIAWYLDFAPHADAMAIDIETKPSEGRIVCVGFSAHPRQGLVLVWDKPKHQQVIRHLCASPCDKVFHNGLYDLWYLRREGVEVNGHIHDTMTMMHALYPTDNVSLAYATSIYTFEPYYKDEIKDADNKTAEENWEQYKEYNSKDACVTREIFDPLREQLREAGLEDFHHEHYERLAEPMLASMLDGVRIDHKKRREVLRELRREVLRTRDALAAYNDGEPLFSLTTQRDQRVWDCMQQGLETVGEIWAHLGQQGYNYTTESIAASMNTIQAKNVSGAKLKKMFYEKYGLPIQLKRRGTGEETETLDIFALRKFRYDYRDNPQIAQMCDLALEHSKTQKLATFITDDKFDEDGRMRFSLKVTTEVGRLASSTSPRGRKVNSQNIPRDSRIRSLVLPDEGHVLLQVDGAQAEARVCFVRTRDSELTRLASLRSHEYDHHRHTGVICGFTPTNEETPENFAWVTKAQRQVCKNISHGSQRQLQGKTLAQTILRDGLTDDKGELIVYEVERCDQIINLYHQRFPSIRQWHQRVRAAIRKDKKLTNSWGRIWPVEFFHLDDELCRRGCSMLLASDIADWLNTFGFRDCYEWLQKNKMQSRIMLQEHDGLVLSCAPDEAYDVATFLRDSLEQPWLCDGVEMFVPVEFQVGSCWGQGTEFGELPSREEFEQVVRELT